jgi:YihY family inner membrane protein
MAIPSPLERKLELTDQHPAPSLSEPAKVETPIEHVRPVVHQEGWWPQAKALAVYLTKTEVHTYAFSVAANVILALYPFFVLMRTLVFQSPAMTGVLQDLTNALLPVGGDVVWRNIHPHKGTQIFSIIMLLITTTGVFLPLEVALNEVWKTKGNRNYLMNQIVSIGLAVAVGVLVMASVGFSAVQRTVLGWVFFGHTDNIVFNFIGGLVLRVLAVVASCAAFFLIYWLLPNRKIPPSAVLPTAVVVGITWEVAKYLYILALPHMDLAAEYGPFRTTVGIMTWSFLSGLLLLGGAHFSAHRYALRIAREAEAEALLR